MKDSSGYANVFGVTLPSCFHLLLQIGNLEDMYVFEPVMQRRQWAISEGTRGGQKRRSLLSQQEQLEADEHVRM